MIKYNFYNPLSCKLAKLLMYNVIKWWRVAVDYFMCKVNDIIIVRKMLTYYQETNLSQISCVTSGKSVKISGPSFFYILPKTACGISRNHANTNSLLFQYPSSWKICCEVSVYGRIFPNEGFIVVWDYAQNEKMMSKFAITHNKYNKQYVLHCLKGI